MREKGACVAGVRGEGCLCGWCARVRVLVSLVCEGRICV